MKSTVQNLRISPKKINLIAALVRNKRAGDALDILNFTPKKGADLLYKVVKSAVKNAENNFKQDLTSLYIKEIIVTKGTVLKRSVPISKGRVHPILKRCAHVNVTIGVDEKAVTAKPAKGKKAEMKAGTQAGEKKKQPTKKVKA
jgi:large subunit ribosomal protein L22